MLLEQIFGRELLPFLPGFWRRILATLWYCELQLPRLFDYEHEARTLMVYSYIALVLLLIC
jgi:hypothetical protein